MTTNENPAAIRICPMADIQCSRGCGTGECKREREARYPDLQPAAAPIDEREYAERARKWRESFDAMHRRAMNAEQRVRELEAPATAPSPADERAAFYLCTPKAGGEGYVIERAPDSFELRDCEIIALQADEKSAFALVRKAILAANRGGDIDVCSLIAADHILSVFGARAASANETGAEGASVTTAEFEAAIETLRHVIHCLRQNGSYTDEEGEATDFLEPLLDARLAAPQPAQADAREGLTDEQREAIDFVIGWYEQSTIAANPYHEHIAALRALLKGAKQ